MGVFPPKHDANVMNSADTCKGVVGKFRTVVEKAPYGTTLFAGRTTADARTDDSSCSGGQVTVLGRTTIVAPTSSNPFPYGGAYPFGRTRITIRRPPRG